MPEKTVSLISPDGKILFNGSVMALPLNPEKIIDMSEEMFYDRDPCILHRTYVMKKIILEIDDYLNRLMGTGKYRVKWNEIPESIREDFSVQGEMEEILVTQEGRGGSGSTV